LLVYLRRICTSLNGTRLHAHIPRQSRGFKIWGR
jgi:hypothetical protein